MGNDERISKNCVLHAVLLKPGCTKKAPGRPLKHTIPGPALSES